MTSTTELTNDFLYFRVSIEKWLVREYGCWSVGQLKNGHLIVIAECGKDYETYQFEVYEYADFNALSEGDAINNLSSEVPNSVLREVAHALGITQVQRFGQTRDVDAYFVNDEWDDVLKDVEYKPLPRQELAG